MCEKVESRLHTLRTHDFRKGTRFMVSAVPARLGWATLRQARSVPAGDGLCNTQLAQAGNPGGLGAAGL